MAMTLQRSYADDMALMEWLNDHIWPFEARQTDDDIRVGALLGASEMLLGGVTSVVDMYWSEAAVFDAVDRAGMRALLCARAVLRAICWPWLPATSARQSGSSVRR